MMGEQAGATLALQIQYDNKTVVAAPRPDDERALKELIGDRQVPVSLDESTDTQGHIAADELVLDVEGHAIAVRLPTAADAAAVRRAFAMGAVTAALVIGGAAAAVTGADLIGAQAADAGTLPGAEVQQPAGGTNPLHRPADIQRE